MNVEELRAIALSYNDVEECTPFGADILVYKVRGKIFLLFGLDEELLSFNVKCDPDRAIMLRESYDFVLPGYHMNKKHWNTIQVTGKASRAFILAQIDHSYELVSKRKK